MKFYAGGGNAISCTSIYLEIITHPECQCLTAGSPYAYPMLIPQPGKFARKHEVHSLVVSADPT